MSKTGLFVFRCLALTMSALATAGPRPALRAPAKGVLCDPYICADGQGISRELTAKYLGAKAAAGKVFTTNGVDLGQFTFANGIFCDVGEKLCRQDRYFGSDGKRSGKVSQTYTALLFGN